MHKVRQLAKKKDFAKSICWERYKVPADEGAFPLRYTGEPVKKSPDGNADPKLSIGILVRYAPEE